MIKSALSIRSRHARYPMYHVMRSVLPVLRLPRRDIWVLFDHASVKRALQDHETFSSQAAPPGKQPLEWLIFLDPPRHTTLRAVILRAFTPKAIANLEPRIRELARELLAQTAHKGHMDVVADFAEPLPLLVISEMIGLPREDHTTFRRWSNAILNLSETVRGGPQAAAAIANFEATTRAMRAYLPRLLELRRRDPQDDLLTRLVEADVDGERLDEQHIVHFVQLLILAGSETTTNLISNTIVSLLEHPDQHALLRARPDLLPSALEEVLRFRSPVQLVFRMTTRDVTLRGRCIPAGQLVLAVVGAANRDPKVFERARHFDITRSRTPNLAFGHGIHYCLGAALARLEARVALEEFLGSVPTFDFAGPRVWKARPQLNVLGPQELPITFSPQGTEQL